MKDRREWLLQIVLRSVQNCLRCQEPFRKSDIHLLGQMNDTWIVALHCHACQNLVIVGLALEDGSIEEPSPTAAEVSTQRPVNQEDLAEMRRFLKSFDGDFRSLFEDLKGPNRAETKPR